MIDIAKLDAGSLGQWVEYRGHGGERERGRIKSWKLDSNIVFVVYKCGGRWKDFLDYTAAGTSPEQLSFIKDEMNQTDL